MPPEKKNIVVTGDGPYAGSLISAGFQQIKNTTWYDRTKRTNEAIERERKLVEDGHVKASDLKPKGAKSGGDAKTCDVLVTVKKDKVIVEKPKGRKKTIGFKKMEKLSELKALCDSFVKAVKDMLAR